MVYVYAPAPVPLLQQFNQNPIPNRIRTNSLNTSTESLAHVGVGGDNNVQLQAAIADKERVVDFLKGIARIRDTISLDEIKIYREYGGHSGAESMQDIELLCGSLTRFTGARTMYLSADDCIYQRIQQEIGFLFSPTNMTALYEGYKSAGPSELMDLLKYRPIEIIGSKLTQIFVSICLGKITDALSQLAGLRELLTHPELVGNHPKQLIGFLFVGIVLDKVVKMVIGSSKSLETTWLIPRVLELQDGSRHSVPSSFNELKSTEKGTVNGLRFYFNDWFNIAHGLRAQIIHRVLEHHRDNVENFLMIAESVRKARRASGGSYQHKISQEEFEWIAEAFELAPGNPFVMLILMDGIVDMLRDARGSFTCGTMVFSSTSHEAVCWMKIQARKLIEEHPRSVRILSRISDYFARFVPLQYFDIGFSEALLKKALELNPTNPETFHRLGILYRMSKGDLEKSLKWFEKAVELDPGYYNAFLECVKNWIGMEDKVDIGEIIAKKLASPEACAWTRNEVLELGFYKGLGHFVRKEYEKMWDAWEIVAFEGPKFFLANIAEPIAWYNWNQQKITLCKLRSEIRRLGFTLPDKPTRWGYYTSQRKMAKIIFNLMVGLESIQQKPYNPPLPTACSCNPLRLKFTEEKEKSDMDKGTGELFKTYFNQLPPK